MSYPINTKINPYAQPLTGLTPQGLPTVDNEKVKQQVNNTPVAKAAASAVDSPGVLLGLMLPLWVGLSKAMEKFNHACADKADGSKNILQKIGDFGDKIGSNKFFNNSSTNKIGDFLSNTKNVIKTKVVDKSSILRAFFYTPSKPTNKMALTQSIGTIAEVANDAATAIEKYTDGGKDLQKVAEFGFSDYKKVIKNPQAHIDEIIDACTKKGGQEFVDMTKQGSFQPVRNLFGRKIYFSEIKNKLTALKGLNNPNQTTALGKILPKASIRVLEGLTNGTAGGKLSILMQAYIFADALVRTYKAPKDEKTKTFAENVIYNLGWYLTMPFGLKMMHKVGGLQYIGMSKARVAKYRQAVDKFNEKAKTCGFADKAEYKAEKQAIKDMLSGKSATRKIAEAKKAGHVLKGEKALSWYHKPFKTVGKVLTVGLENLRGYTKAGDSKFLKAMKNSGFKMKDIAGYPVRIGLFMFVIAPFLGKLSAKASHLVFGRPTKSVLDDEAEEKPAQPAAASAAPAAKPQSAVTNPQAVVPGAVQGQAAVKSASNLLNIYNLNTQTKATEIAKQPAKSLEPVRTYIPSSAGVVIQKKTEGQQQAPATDDKVAAALNRANYAEQEALKFLAGH